MASEPTFSVNPNAPLSDDTQSNVYDDGYLRVEHDNFYVNCAGNRLTLPLKEFLIFSRLVRNIERVVTSQEIWRSAWGVDAPYNSLTLRVHIHRLRRTFHPFGIRLDSMVGVGYCLSCSQPTATQSQDAE